MAGVRAKPNQKKRFQGWFTDDTGKQKFFLGTRSRPETLRMAERLEDEHRQVRLGYRPAPTSADRSRTQPFGDMVTEYLAWGEAQGGRGGKGWAPVHAHNRLTDLMWWKGALGLKTLADLQGILPRAERALRVLLDAGKTGKTAYLRAQALRAFGEWCRQRGYLDQQPLEGLAPFDTAPKTTRRALTAEEINGFLGTCTPHLRLLYETAFLSGLRAKELRNLTIVHLDQERSGLHLDAEWTKNRQPGFQPLPKALVERLNAFCQAGEPDRLYEQAYTRNSGRQAKAPKGRLLFVPTHTEKAVAEDLNRAGIPHWTSQGKVDFHALRVAFINQVIDSGATVKEAQTLARHSTADLTMNVYGRTRPERLAETVERMAEKLIPSPEHVPSMYKQAVGAETENATPSNSKELRFGVLAPAVGLEPTTWWLTATRSAS